MPLAFGAHAGSLLALTGTPVNVIVSDAADDAGAGGFGFFEFALVGVPLAARDDRDRRALRRAAAAGPQPRAAPLGRLQPTTRARSPSQYEPRRDVDAATLLTRRVRAWPRS